MAQVQSDGELARYLELTPRSRTLFEEGKRFLPGADTRSSVFWSPYPVTLVRGQGCRVWDADGMERVDFVNNMTSLVLGHAHPEVVSALQEQAAAGTAFAAPTESQVCLARILCQRIPSVDLVRFSNSGTEATMNCIRAARALTGRTMIAKAEGGYHGTHDAVSISVSPALDEGGDQQRPSPVPVFPGMPRDAVREAVIIPFNDVEATREILQERRRELAAVIVEPVMGAAGMIAAEQEYLTMLRDVTQDNDIVLIFDEVISLRLAPGGAQEYYGVMPDLTAMGKIVGGGLPVGAFGGRQEIMELFDPTHGPRVSHAGTFQGNPMTMVAGAVTMEALTPQVYARLADVTERLKVGVRSICAEFNLPVQVTGLGSLFGIHFTDKPVRTYRDAAPLDKALQHRIFLGLMNEGVFATSRFIGCLSTPMGEWEVDAYLDALRKVLARMGQ